MASSSEPEARVVGSKAELTAQLAVEVVVPNLSDALEFYGNIGFVVERHAGAFVSLRWGTSYLFLAEDAAATTAPRWANVRVIVPDVDEAWRRVTSLGLSVVNAIGDRAYGLRDFVVRCPAGFEVRFASVLDGGAT